MEQDKYAIIGMPERGQLIDTDKFMIGDGTKKPLSVKFKNLKSSLRGKVDASSVDTFPTGQAVYTEVQKLELKITKLEAQIKTMQSQLVALGAPPLL